MISDALPKWTVVIVIFLGGLHSQMPMVPMGYGYGGPMMMPPPMPMPMPVPVPFGIPIPYPESTTTTTTTESPREEENDNRIPIAIPIPLPHMVQIAVPGFMPPNCKSNGNGGRNKNCPPCPPCSCNPCTPSFFSFCSPCHLECRCKNGKENPIPREPDAPKPFPGPAFPMPVPLPAPGPVVIVPFPPQFVNRRPNHSDCESHTSSCSKESTSHDSCESGKSRRKRKRNKGKNKKRKKNFDIYRRNFMRNRSDRRDGLVSPVLTYRSRNGDIKVERRLSNDEANILLGGRKSYVDMEPYNRAKNTYTDVQLTAGEDSNKRQRLLVKSEPVERRSHHRREELLIGRSHHNLGNGKKELLFKTPENKTITNLTVSFQISK
ncbi:hypothetical protein PYW07_016320 [Mythimna separata]|uniref:Uncharacterized protein n=1 Tax=Mythimna separata TaxID=271217 RepID=A0AAD7YKB4_MYTSE|nr:hypothetical protein PYW07_016320 [Mythimna separata]